jgi:hypothetical protein
MAIPASQSVFKIDSTSLPMREYVRKYQSQVGASSLQIKTADAYDEIIDINEANFFAENASFVNGTVIVGEADDDHAVFGASEGTRTVTTSDTYNLLKGTYLSIKSVCGETSGGSIVLEEDPDGDEDLVMEVMLGESEFVRLPGRITERNSSTTAYIEYRFLMTQDDGDYFIRITQTEHSGDGRDYYAFKNLRTNINTSFYDPVNKINVF